MATRPQGYHCEFIDQVFEGFYCKKCTLVARRLTITTCCAESFCQDCIAGTIDQCPACGENDFTTFQHAKNRKRINNLQVYCIMKEMGCGWSGTLEQLDSHLDPDQDNCQYVDTKCPLNCQQTIPKNKMEQHVAEECVKRAFVCKHCSFKATYEEVVDIHLPECKYVPLQCPNRCGVTCERDFMEDHMKICRLEDVGCEFSGLGCEGRFRREDQEEHTRQNSQQHLTYTALLAMETKEQLQQKILELQQIIQEQDKKHKENEKKLNRNVKELEKILVDIERKLQDQDKEHIEEEQELKKKLEEQEKKLHEQDEEFTEEGKKLKQILDEQRQMLEENFDLKLSKLKEMLQDFKTKSDKEFSYFSKVAQVRNFEMKNFSQEKAKNKVCDWKSPAMYTHVCGYKFCIGVDANGFGEEGHGKAIFMRLFVMPGEYDGNLKWPAKAKFTVELINQRGGKNASSTTEATWILAYRTRWVCEIFGNKCTIGFIEHSKLGDFLDNNTLYFCVPNIELM